MKNEAIRQKARELDLKLWEIADAAGIAQSTLTVWMRKELSGERLARVTAALEKLEADRRN